MPYYVEYTKEGGGVPEGDSAREPNEAISSRKGKRFYS